MKKIWLLAFIAFIAIEGMLGYYLLTKPVVQSSPGVVYDLKPGLSKHLVIQQLYQQGIIKHPYALTAYAYLSSQKHMKTGEYLFPKNASMRSIWQQVTSGRGLYYRKFAIIPGWTFGQLRLAIAKTPELKQTTASMTDEQVMAKLGHVGTSPEGEFLPETYFYTKGEEDYSILKRAFSLMQTKFAAAWVKRANNLPYKTPFEALIAASLVEREAFLDSERPIIAGVIINRLNKNMLLQIDPTVIFGLGDKYDGTITRKDLQTDTPYNTYTRKGLPPTPISLPSLGTIEAVLHPAVHEYYYFVARGDGSHQFSKSLEEHHQAVKAADIVSKKNRFFNESMLRSYLAAHMWSYYS